MKTLYKTLVALIVLASTGLTAANAQDARFTPSFYSNPLKLNPAVMGMNSDLKIMLNYRSQWGSIGSGYTSSSFTAMSPIFLGGNNEKLDLGLNVTNNKEGAFSDLDAKLAIGYNVKLSNSGYLSFTLQGGLIQKSLDATSLTFDDQYVLGSYDPANPTSQAIASEKVSFADLGFGMMWYFNSPEESSKLHGYVGVSGYHLNQSNETFVVGDGNLNRRFSCQAGLKIRGENKIDFTPNIIANFQSASQEIIGGIIMDYRVGEDGKALLGAWYRAKDSYPIMLGFDHKYFLVNYTYDMTSSILGNTIAGLSTHEITLAYRMNMASKKGVDLAPSIY